MEAACVSVLHWTCMFHALPWHSLMSLIIYSPGHVGLHSTNPCKCSHEAAIPGNHVTGMGMYQAEFNPLDGHLSRPVKRQLVTHPVHSHTAVHCQPMSTCLEHSQLMPCTEAAIVTQHQCRAAVHTAPGSKPAAISSTDHSSTDACTPHQLKR